MTTPGEATQNRSAAEVVLASVNECTGGHYRLLRRLVGGEQSGAHLVVEDARPVVLKWEPVGWRADQLLRAFPAVVYATNEGWPAANWLEAGSLPGGGTFLLQEYVEGTPVSRLDLREVQVVVAANARQSGLAFGGAPNDSEQLEDLLSGQCEWTAHVRDFTSAGAALVEHGNSVARWAGPASVPVTDVVHGDYSSTNILLDPECSAATFVDCQGVGRGSRVRDLADLYRQSFVYPDPTSTGLDFLRSAAVAVEGPQVFAKCAVAVTYANLAWWVEHKTPVEFDRACSRLHRLFDDVRGVSRQTS